MDIRRRALLKRKASSSGGSTTGGSYTVNLNSQWEKTTAVTNPDSTLYDGVYRSSSNYNVNNGVSIMYITIKDCISFKMYIRSYAESNYDYVMVSQLDKTITGSSSYSDTTLVKAHTRGNQQSGTALSSYTLVEFTGISSGEHTITVVYRKDSSQHSGDDRGYVLIEKMQAGSGDDEGGSSEGLINVDNYLTIEALEDGLTASLSVNVCEYCVDGDGNWKTLAAGTATESINSGQTLSFRGELTPTSSNNIGIGTFTISKKCNLKGNCMSMLFGDNAANNYSLNGKDYAFNKLFNNCSNIVNVSSGFLPATTLAVRCYNGMFSYCTSLTTAPELPATTLASYCYRTMFYGCSSLTAATELPATTLAYGCYSEMFYGCTSLTTAPELPATTLATNCYEYMFYGCSKLNYIKMLATNISASGCLSGWVSGVASTGTFVKHSDMTSLPTGISGIPSGWTVVNDEKEPIDIDNYLTIEALEDGLTASLSTNACEYCVDGVDDWKSLTAGNSTESINTGQTLSFRGSNLTPTSSAGIGTFTISKKCNLKGNCMSMLFGDDATNNYSLSGKNYAFKGLFSNCTNVVNVSENFLPATTLAENCYLGMFSGCTSLTTAPTLQATSLAKHCYEDMFWKCTSLTTAPTLPATSLANYCYQYMFCSCTSLTTAPELTATRMGHSSYLGMFQNCTSLTTAPELPATSLATSCYEDMFYGCTLLTTAPTLPATSLAEFCYRYMFRNCTSLTTAPELPATSLANYCYTGMFYDCTSLTTAPSLPVKTLKHSCYESMFRNCTSLTTAPELPATSLATYCYKHMFNGCSKLTSTPSLPVKTLGDSCYSGMFQNCTSLTTAPELPATSLTNYCYSYMFSGCTSLTTAPELPATSLANYCYQYMFSGCSKLNYIKMLATNISASNCLSNWVSGVASTGTFVKNPDMSTLLTGASGIPSGWTVVNDGEENSIFPMYLNTTYDSSRGLYYRDEDDSSRSLWEWIEQNREKYPDGIMNEDYIPATTMSQCELYIDDVKVEYLSTDGPGSDNYWNWSPKNSKYNTGAFESIRILEGGRIEIWED